jgi:uncharacterized membrane protein (DUF4010 family)
VESSPGILESVEARIAIALVTGLVLGAEREQRQAEGGTAHRVAGIRTFAIAALLGAIAQVMGSPVALALFGAAVVGGTMVAYAFGDRTDPGITSELALVLSYALGALAISRPTLSLGLGIVTAMLLAFRAPIHSLVREVLSPAELRDALIVAAAALVVLPLLPNRTIDPWHVLNLFTLWRLLVVVLMIHFAAHVLQRVLGPKWGLAIAGLASGFVSSSATIAAMGNKAREDPRRLRGAVAAATASTVATFVQMAALVAAASTSLLVALAVPLAAGAVVAFVFAGVFAFRAANSPAMDPVPSRAVDIRGASIFAAFVSVVTVGSSLVQRTVGGAGVVIAAAIAAFADTHAAAASIASVHAAHQLSTKGAVLAVLACISANTLTKGVLAAVSGPRAYSWPVLFGLGLVVASTWIGWGIGHAFAW